MSVETKWTPGPWSAGGNSAYKTVLKNAKGESIASGGNNRAIQGEVLEASLTLAAAAPEMYDVLARAEHAIEALDGTSVENERLVDDYRAVMRKARGKA